jgi:hypothetical protein
MNKLLAVLIAGAFATVAAAQTPAPAPAAPMKPTTKERAADVKSSTEAAAASTTGAKTAADQAASVKASKEVAKMTTAEKKAFVMEFNKRRINPATNPTMREWDDPRGIVGADDVRRPRKADQNKPESP